jgi:hypothetical protein
MSHSNSNAVAVWVHGDCLSSTGPALTAYPNAPALWVWDEALLQDWQFGFRHARFIYDCLLELPVTIQRGDVVTELIKFARKHQADRIATTGSSSPGFLQICQQLQAHGLQVEIYESAPSAQAHQIHCLDLKQFAHCWQMAQ